MQLKKLLDKKNYSNSSKVLKTIAIVDDRQIDSILDDNSDLYPANYRSWHAKFIKQFGLEIWLRCASTARQEGKNPERYLVWLLNRSC